MEEMSSSSHGHPNKRPKPPSPGPAPPPCGKGKAGMEEFAPEVDDDGGADTASDADERTCGICLMEEGRSIRGAIDSCDHYFCFVCIMEWAKIESRCPLCKQRFGSIRRPPVRGVLSSERVVSVPARDQVHQSFGNATGGGDPYADTTCSACHGSTDENLLLLCDLCDSAAHTYCIGLGFTVPEGDWYCHDCTILRNEQTKMQHDDHCSDENFSRVSRTMTEDCSPVSISELIRDETSSYSFSGSQINVIGRGTNDREPKDKAAVKQNSKRNALNSDERPSRLATAMESSSSLPEARATEIGARTLHQCRNLHLRIRVLRDNWYALQSGSLDFRSSLLFSCGASNNREHNKRGIISSVSRQQDYQSSGCNDEVAGAGSQVSNEMNSCSSSHDVDKAWKMLEIAKSMHRAPTGAKCGHQSSNLPHKKRNGENKALEQRDLRHISDHKSPACPTSRRILKNKVLENRLFGGTGLGKYFRHDASELLREKCKHQNSRKMHDKIAEEMGHCDQGPLSSVQENSKRDRELCHGNGGRDSQHRLYHATGSGRLKDVSACSGPSNCNQVGTFRPAGKTEAPEDVGCNIFPSNVSSVLGKTMDESSSSICNNAKSEIQSLVKLNMKLQCKGHHLGNFCLY